MSNTTTLVRGWKLTRRDNVVLAFTDCDIDLTVGGVTYLASAALTPSEAAASLGLNVDDQEIQGALSSDAISESDLAIGLYDGAAVEVIEIDWETQTKTATIGAYYIGEVMRTESAFSAELRSGVGVLSQTRGRYLTAACDAELGDSRCGKNISSFIKSGAVTSITGDSQFLVAGLENETSGLYSKGTVVWTSGANVGQSPEVRNHNGESLGLWHSPLFPVQIGDAFEIAPGCDKSFQTCRGVFNNGNGFRGFPTIAGQDAFRYAVTGEGGLDGKSYNSF